MVVDVGFVVLIAPILAFLLVAFVVGAILVKIKLFEDNKWMAVFVGLIVASLFVASVGLTDLVLTIVPWIAVLFVSLVFFLMLVGFVGGLDNEKKVIGIIFMVLFGIVLLVSTFVVFNNVIINYLPGPGFGGSNSDPEIIFFFDWLYSPRVFGTILLVVASALVSWFLVKAPIKSGK